MQKLLLMKKTIITFLIGGIIGVGSFAQAQDRKRAPHAPKASQSDRLEAFGKSLKDAVAAGKLTEKEAHAKWAAVSKRKDSKKPALRKKEPPKGKKPLPIFKRPAKPEVSDETKAQFEAIKKDKDSLKKEIGEELAKRGLGKGSSKEEVRAAVEAFRKANQDRFDAIKAASDKVHESIKASRPDRKKRPELHPQAKEALAAIRSMGKKLHDARTELRKELKESSKEDRKELIEKFKSDHKEQHEELKAAKKEFIDYLRSAKETGESRTSE